MKKVSKGSENKEEKLLPAQTSIVQTTTTITKVRSPSKHAYENVS